MPRLNDFVAKYSKQKLIPAVVVSVLGPLCSVRLSGVGTQLNKLTYVGPTPIVGEGVIVNYQTGTPYVMVGSISSEASRSLATTMSTGGGGGGGGITNNYYTVEDTTIFIDQSSGTDDTYGILGGTIYGDNVEFTVSQLAYISGTLLVFLNGVLQIQGSDKDWHEDDPASGTFHFAIAPEEGDVITVVYGSATIALPEIVHSQIIWTIEDTNLTADDEGVKPLKFRLPYVGAGAIIEEIYVQLGTTPGAANLRIDVMKNGATLLNTTAYIEIAVGNTTASRTTDFVDGGAIAKDDYFQIELVQGDATAADLSVHMRFKWTLTTL